VPGGFATTAHAFRQFLQHDGLARRISVRLEALDTDDVRALAEAGQQIRQWIVDTPFPSELSAACAQFESLTRDHPDASLRGALVGHRRRPARCVLRRAAGDLPQRQRHRPVLHRVKEVFASLYNDRAISYRVHKGFAHGDVALSAGVQRMVRSDLGASGVMFTIDTESGFKDVVFITAATAWARRWCKARSTPTSSTCTSRCCAPASRRSSAAAWAASCSAWSSPATPSAASGKLVRTVDTPPELRNRYSLSDADVIELARYAVIIERHYGRPMDIEWGKDGQDGKLYILQAAPRR
jgi:pyruvate,water dikinase